jgi:hypothetical protein
MEWAIAAGAAILILGAVTIWLVPYKPPTQDDDDWWWTIR